MANPRFQACILLMSLKHHALNDVVAALMTGIVRSKNLMNEAERSKISSSRLSAGNLQFHEGTGLWSNLCVCGHRCSRVFRLLSEYTKNIVCGHLLIFPIPPCLE